MPDGIEGRARTGPPVPDLLDVFTPARPKVGVRSLTGRRVELDRIVSAVMDERRHVVLYSERGRGKTSLANAAVEVLRARGVVAARFTCHAGSSFHEIFKGLLRDLPGSLLAVSAQQRHGIGCEAALPEDRLNLADLVRLPSRLTCQRLVCVVDEFDRVQDAAVRSQFADAIKHLSDRGSHFVFLLIGVSENLDKLLGDHESVRRNIVPIALPLLTSEEVRTMVKTGAKEAGFDIEYAVIDQVAVLAGGIPHVAQSVALRTMQVTASRRDVVTSEVDLCQAALRLTEEADPGVVERYAGLTSQGQDRVMIRGLQVIGTAKQDLYGRFEVFIDERVVELSNGQVPVECWQRASAAGVVSQGDPGRPNKVLIGDRDLLTFGLLLRLSQHSRASELRAPAAPIESGQSEGALIELAGTR